MVSNFSIQHQPGYLKISKVYPAGSMGRVVCIGLVVEGDGRSLEEVGRYISLRGPKRRNP